MPAVDPVILELRANLRDYDARLNASTLRAERSFDAQSRAIQRLELQVATSSGHMSSRLDRASQVSIAALSRLQGAFGAVSVIALARTFLSIADTSKQMNAQLQLATQTFGSFGQAQNDTTRIAEQARAGLSETVSLYGSFIRTASEIGRTQGDAARATETFSKALKIGGAGTAQVASATLQMGQALASANVQWEELGQILEASPRLAKVFTDSLGVTRAELKKMAEDGKLTGKMLFDALNQGNITAGIDAEFKTLPVTFDDAMTKVRNAAIVTFGAFDRGGEFSTALANFITQGSEGFGDLESAAEQLGIGVAADFAGLRSAFDPMVEGAFSAFGQVEGRAREAGAYIEDVLRLLDQAANVRVDLANFSTRVRNGLINGGVLNQNFAGGPQPLQQRQDMAGAFRRARNQYEASRRSTLAEDRLNERAGLIPGTLRMRGSAPAPAAPPRPSVTASGGGGGRGTARRPSAETVRRREESDHLRALRDDQQFENEKAGLNADLLRAKQSIATAADTIAQYELQEIEAQRARQNANYQAGVAQKQITQARANELIALNDEVAAERVNAVRLREEERKRAERVAIAEGDLQNARDLATAEESLAETTDDRRRSALRLLDLEYEMERARLDAVLASKQATEAEKEIARRRLALLPQLEQADRADVERSTEGSYARYRRELPDTLGEVNDRLDDLKVDAMRHLEDSIVSATTKALGLKGALGDIVGEIIRIGIQRRLIGPIADALFGAAGGAGGQGAVGGFLTKLFGRASGGYVGAGQLVRVNEGASPGRVEGFRPAGAGTVIPLGRMDAVARPAQPQGGVTTVRLELSEDIDARMVNVAGPVAVQIVRQAAPEIVESATANTFSEWRKMRL